MRIGQCAPFLTTRMIVTGHGVVYSIVFAKDMPRIELLYLACLKIWELKLKMLDLNEKHISDQCDKWIG